MCRSEARRSMTSSNTSAKSSCILIRPWVREVRGSIGRPAGAVYCRGGSWTTSGRLLVALAAAGAGDAGDLGHRGEAVLDLVQAVLAQPAHAAPDRGRPEPVGRGTLQGERADLLG